MSFEMPFNAGEIEVQKKMGVHERVMSYAPRVIRDHLLEEHQQFYQQLPLLFVGSLDNQGRPWASAVFGQPGFITSPSAKSLQIGNRPSFGDPLNQNLEQGSSTLGFLGLEHHSRRRNRLSGKVVAQNEDGFKITVSQSFGNCPRYIHARAFEVLPSVQQQAEARPIHRLTTLNERAKQIISDARSFFIASHYGGHSNDPTQGADMSHRGGLPGFVKIEGDSTLIYPEFAGNNHYNTLGNLHRNPVAGLLFMDFESGDLLYLTCRVEIIWDGEAVTDFSGAKQLLRLHLDEAVLVENVMPLRWQSLEESANFAGVGSWEAAKVRGEARKKTNGWRPFRVTAITRESNSIKSFELEPMAGSKVMPFKAGQFLPVRVLAEGWDKAHVRTYSISNAPGNGYYRISIKREGGSGDVPQGRVSSYFHDQLSLGSVIEVGKPAGKFTYGDHKAVVLLSAGVGITPMLSMLDQQAVSGENNTKLWFIHGAANSAEHSFAAEVGRRAKNMANLKVHYSYSKPLATDKAGLDYQHHGRIDLNLLKRILPFDDYHFYICGPAEFVRNLVEGLRSMNISGERISYEFFGKNQLNKELAKPSRAACKTVNFTGSKLSSQWQQGSLLELAEAAGIEAPFECRVGACGTCSTKLKAGKVVYPDGHPLALNAGEVLLCCAQPDPNSEEPLILEV